MTGLRWTVLAILLLGIGSVGAWRYMGSPRTEGGLVNNGALAQATPEAILEHVKAQKSPVTLINFWASWCEPCKEEFPYILKVKRDLAAKGLNVVFVSVDDVGDAGAAQAFLKSQKVEFQTFYKGSQHLNFVTHIYPQWTGAVPTSVLMGPDLKILDAWEGDTSQAEFESRIQKFLKGS